MKTEKPASLSRSGWEPTVFLLPWFVFFWVLFGRAPFLESHPWCSDGIGVGCAGMTAKMNGELAFYLYSFITVALACLSYTWLGAYYFGGLSFTHK
ncbi:MAG: hypothetical protein LBF16_07735 [Pseudomonadales bacterium]|nr:hypothetical protein [Pseudomonadales bacterium]